MAERAWAYAMELKQQASESARKKHHVVKRLAKASQSAQRLEILCGSLSPESLLQSNAYSASMRANEAFERLEYQKSLDLFCSALSFYDTLEKAADPALEPYFQSARDEIEPSVQFLCYSLKVESGKTVDIEQLLSICDTSQVPGLELVSAKINAFIKTSARKTDRQGEPHLLEFIDGPVVVNNRDLVDRLVLIATFKNGIRSSDDPAAFDRLLAMYWDATTFLNALIESDKKMAEKISSSKTQAASESLALASSFIAYGRITTTIGRHMCLLRNPQLIVISHSSKEKLAEERFKLSRAITKCIQEMESLVCFTTSAKFQDLVLFSQGVFEALRYSEINKGWRICLHCIHAWAIPGPRT